MTKKVKKNGTRPRAGKPITFIAAETVARTFDAGGDVTRLDVTTVAPLNQLKKPKGGKRPGAGMPKGHKTLKTITKEQARDVLRSQVIANLKPLIDAQLQNAQGISHFMLRDPKTGKFDRLTDPAQIQAALNADGAAEGSTYYIWTKDPSIQAFTDLMNRALDKPAEQPQVVVLDATVSVINRLQEARKRLAAHRATS